MQSKSAPTGKKGFSRGCYIYAVGAFLLPVAVLIYGALETSKTENEWEAAGTAIGTGILVAIGFVWAFSTGIAAVVLGYLLGRNS